MVPVMKGKLKQAGFTITEMMITMAIIGVLMAIAVPSLLRSRLGSNEEAMKLDLRAFGTGNEAFRAARTPTPAYAANINELQGIPNPPAFIDASWGTAAGKHGFLQVYAGGGGATPNSYSLRVSPLTPNVTAVNTYCIDQNGIILGSVNGAGAPVGDPAGCVGGVAIP